MDSEFQQWAIKYAKLFAVISAIVVLLSWLIENLLVNKLNDLKEHLQSLENEKLNSERQFHIESKLLEVYQVAASARQYALLSVDKSKINADDSLTRIIDKLERIGVTKKFVISFIMYANRHSESIEAINPPDSIKNKVESSYKNLLSIQDDLMQLDKEYKSKQKEVTGSENTINPNSLNEEMLNKLYTYIESYRAKVESNISNRLTESANSMFRAYDDLFRFAKTKIKRLEKVYNVAKVIQIILFVIGSIIAIYGTYLEAISPKK